MTEEEWIEKYRDEIWVPKKEHDGTQFIELVSGYTFIAACPIRLDPDLKAGCFAYYNDGVAVECAKNEMDIFKYYKRMSREKAPGILTYNVQEMFIPDGSFVHGRFSLCVILECDNIERTKPLELFYDWSNAMTPEYLDTIELGSTVMNYKYRWVDYRQASCFSQDKSKYHFEKENNGVYISPVFKIEIPDGYSTDIFDAVVEWKRKYFEEANKRNVR